MVVRSGYSIGFVRFDVIITDYALYLLGKIGVSYAEREIVRA